MERVKYYSAADLSTGYNLSIGQEILEFFDDSKKDYQLVEILNFYNISKFIDYKIYLNEWSDPQKEKYKITVKKMKKQINLFFNSINDDNCEQFINSLGFNDIGDFFEILSTYKLHHIISEKCMKGILINRPGLVYEVIKNQYLVLKWDKILYDLFLTNPHTAEYLLDKYASEHKSNRKELFIPHSIASSNKEKIILDYLDSPDANLNYIRLIVIMRSSNIQISDTTRLKAKKLAESLEKEYFPNDSGMPLSITVIFSDSQIEERIIFNQSTNWEFSYSKQWISLHNDYPTLLNNFIYLFDYVDIQMRINLINKEWEMGVLEPHLGINSRKHYATGIEYFMKDKASTLQLEAYINELELINIDFINLIEWFFEIYLKNEFNVNSYRFFSPSKNSSLLEKCRTLCSEIDGILKQFNSFVKHKEIDWELISLTSQQLFFHDINSLLEKKYIYAKISKEFNLLSFYFFSDQSSLNYLPESNTSFRNFYTLLQNETVGIKSFPNYAQQDINYLISNKYLEINQDGYIQIVDNILIMLIGDLHINGAINYWKYPKIFRDKIDNLIETDFFFFENTLFSKPEQDYLNYHLNNSEFDNSLGIRNIYLHGVQPGNEKDSNVHMENYYVLIKLVVLIVIKINDDFCMSIKNR